MCIRDSDLGMVEAMILHRGPQVATGHLIWAKDFPNVSRNGGEILQREIIATMQQSARPLAPAFLWQVESAKVGGELLR